MELSIKVKQADLKDIENAIDIPTLKALYQSYGNINQVAEDAGRSLEMLKQGDQIKRYKITVRQDAHMFNDDVLSHNYILCINVETHDLENNLVGCYIALTYIPGNELIYSPHIPRLRNKIPL